MKRVRIVREIRDRLRGLRDQGLWKAAQEFEKTVLAGPNPRGVWKSSGVNRRGARFEPYIQLGLWHLHLSNDIDPLLIVQKVPGPETDDVTLVGFALTDHAAYFGDEWQWLWENQEGIDWTGHEGLLARVQWEYKSLRPR